MVMIPKAVCWYRDSDKTHCIEYGGEEEVCHFVWPYYWFSKWRHSNGLCSYVVLVRIIKHWIWQTQWPCEWHVTSLHALCSLLKLWTDRTRYHHTMMCMLRGWSRYQSQQRYEGSLKVLETSSTGKVYMHVRVWSQWLLRYGYDYYYISIWV